MAESKDKSPNGGSMALGGGETTPDLTKGKSRKSIYTRAASSNDVSKLQLSPTSAVDNNFADKLLSNERELISPSHNIPKTDIVEDD